ncbi:MAG: hypothetical protein SFV20_04560 [Sphingopyxis sp.]|nr:hypothetical protein [Sphingopyxis sp.]
MSAIERRTKPTQCAFKARAQSQLNLRRQQRALFGNGWVSDAWWEFMLIIYASEQGAVIDRFSLAGETDQSFELTERWLTLLIDHGYVRRVGSQAAHDSRAHELTDVGRATVEQCLGAAGGTAFGGD